MSTEMAPEKTELLRWFDELVSSRYGTMKRLAEVAHRGQGALTRSAAQTGSAGLEPLLRLAEDTGESPSRVLSLAKKEEMDALIRKLYGQPSVTLPADVQRVVDFLLLDDSRIASIQGLMKASARDWLELLRSPPSTAARDAGTSTATTGTHGKRGPRSR